MVLLAVLGACGKGIAVRDASEAPATLRPGTRDQVRTHQGAPVGTREQGRGEPEFRCVAVRGDLGDCDSVLGYGFDGARCREFRGCDCGSECDHLTADPLVCASTCGAAGRCDEAAIHAAALAQGPVRSGSFCDELTACARTDTVFAGALAQLGLKCEEPGFPCADGRRCHLQFQGTIDAAGWQKTCAVSLLPGADLQCVLWGP